MWHVIAFTKADCFGKFTTKVCRFPGLLLYAVNTTYTDLLNADTQVLLIILSLIYLSGEHTWPSPFYNKTRHATFFTLAKSQ